MVMRPTLRYGLWGLAVLALLVPALAWLAGSEAALRLLALEAEGLSGSRLEIRGVHGSVYGPLRIDTITLTTETKRFIISGTQLDWSPRALWQHRLQISQMEMAELRVNELKPSAEPPMLPSTLDLPFGLSLPEASLARLVIQTGAGEQVLGDIRLGLERPDHTYRLDLRNLTTPWGQAQGQASLADAPPYALTGQARFTHPSGTATANIGGSLTRIALKAAAALAGGQADADILLTPFAARPLAEVQVDARAIDPAAWDSGLPHADLGVTASLHSQGEQDYAGDVTASNGLPGTWDRKRLPLRALSARFSGSADGLDLTDLRLDLAQAGHLTGSGRADPKRLTVDLATRDLDPRGLYGKLRSLRLAGTLRLQADAQRQGLQADLAYRRYRLVLAADLHDQVIQIKQALLSSGAGSLNLFGALGLDAAHSLDLAGGLEGFDPAAFGDYPKARINASFRADGRLSPAPAAALSFAIADSRLRDQPLSGQGNLSLSAKRLWDSEAELRLAGNRLSLQGAFGAPGDQLAFRLQAGQLGIVHSDLSGRIEATGKLAGSLSAPSGEVDIQADGLAWGQDYRLGSLHAQARLDQGLAGNLALDARLTNLKTPHLSLDRAGIQGQGRRDRHRLTLTADSPDLQLSAELAGAWRESDWSGQVLRLTSRGRHPLTLLAPAQLEIAVDGGRLADARLSALGADINIREARYQAGRFSSRGEVKGLTIAALGRLVTLPEQIGGDLVLAGGWQIDAGDRADGRIALARERGDLVLTTAPATALGLRRLSLLVEAADSRLHASLEADGTALGKLRAQADSRLGRRDGAWGLAADTPFQASADLALQSLAWAAPWLDKSGATRFDGSLTAQVQGSGSLAAPRFTGSLAGERFSLALADQGLDLKDGRFQAELDQDTLVLKSLSLRGGDGQLTGQGRLGLRENQPDLQLTLKADRLQVVSRPDRLLILSGTGEVALLARKLQLRAKLKADRGLVELAGADTPTLSEDVVVLGREDRTAAKGLPYAVDMDLDLSLGDRFYFKGRGLDAQLGGSVQLIGRQGLPLRANGGIRVVKGTYAAYGQRLDIERGLLNFQGPLDNPGLNIQAMRKNQPVEAGLTITGSVQAPVVKLVSNPTVPDGEKLSWLVLGHGMADTGGSEFDALQLAAGALLGAGESVTLQQRIAHAAGLEEVSLKGKGTLESSVLTLGKRLSSRAYLSYEQGLLGTSALVKINYTLSRHLSVRTQAGTTPAVDLFYTFSFD